MTLSMANRGLQIGDKKVTLHHLGDFVDDIFVGCGFRFEG